MVLVRLVIRGSVSVMVRLSVRVSVRVSKVLVSR